MAENAENGLEPSASYSRFPEIIRTHRTFNDRQVKLSVRKFLGRSAWTEQLKQGNCWKWLKMAENAENGW